MKCPVVLSETKDFTGQTEMFYVYVLRSLKDKGLYIGYSENLRQRIKEHNRGKNSSTRNRRPLRLIYYEAYLEKGDALGREKFLKSGSGRKFLNKQLKIYFDKE